MWLSQGKRAFVAHLLLLDKLARCWLQLLMLRPVTCITPLKTSALPLQSAVCSNAARESTHQNGPV